MGAEWEIQHISVELLGYQILPPPSLFILLPGHTCHKRMWCPVINKPGEASHLLAVPWQRLTQGVGASNGKALSPSEKKVS